MIATPGRLEYMIEEISKKNENSFKLKELEVLVLDEADRYVHLLKPVYIFIGISLVFYLFCVTDY